MQVSKETIKLAREYGIRLTTSYDHADPDAHGWLEVDREPIDDPYSENVEERSGPWVALYALAPDASGAFLAASPTGQSWPYWLQSERELELELGHFVELLGIE